MHVTAAELRAYGQPTQVVDLGITDETGARSDRMLALHVAALLGGAMDDAVLAPGDIIDAVVVDAGDGAEVGGQKVAIAPASTPASVGNATGRRKPST